MTILQRALSKRTQINGPVPLTSTVLLEWLGNSTTSSGMSVNIDTTLSLSSASRCVQLISGRLASVGVRQVDGVSGEHSKVPLLEYPNPWYDRFQFRELLFTHILLYGNAYSYIERTTAGIKALHPLDPTKIEVKIVVKPNGTIAERLYVYTPTDSSPIAVPAAKILHIPGWGFDGLSGRSPISMHREGIGTVLAAEKYAGKLFGNGNLMSGLLTTEKRLTPEAATALKNRWREKVQGLDNAHDIAILDAGAKFESLSIPPQEAQFIQARKFGVEEIARMYGVPLSLLNATGNQGESTAVVSESEIITFVQFTLDPLAERVNAAYERVLFENNEDQSITHLTARLIKADTRTRSSASVMWRKSKVKSINELRAEEGLPALSDPEADDPMSDVGADGAGGQDPGTNAGNPESLQPQGDVVVDPAATQ